MANLPPLTRHLHVVDGFGPDERETQIRRRMLIRRLVLAAARSSCRPATLQRIATEVWKLPQRVVRYVPNGIDLAIFRWPRHSATRHPPVIGTVAALRPRRTSAA